METLYKKGLLLEYFTVAYNAVEAVAAIVFGKIAKQYSPDRFWT